MAPSDRPVSISKSLRSSTVAPTVGSSARPLPILDLSPALESPGPSAPVPAPPSPLPTTGVAPSTAPAGGELEILQELILRTEQSNARIRKYNNVKKLLREDRNRKEPVSDDEEEDPMPDISAFVRPNAAPSSAAPSILVTPPSDPTVLTSTQPEGATLTSTSFSPPSVPLSVPTSAGSNTSAVSLPSLEMLRTAIAKASDPSSAGGGSAKANPNPPIDYKSLPPIYNSENSPKGLPMRVTDIPDQVLQMAFNKLYIPLSMLTVTALNKIRCNHDVRYKKISFGLGAGRQTLDESQFPAEDTLDAHDFLQAYNHWLSIVDLVADPTLCAAFAIRGKLRMKCESLTPSYSCNVVHQHVLGAVVRGRLRIDATIDSDKK